MALEALKVWVNCMGFSPGSGKSSLEFVEFEALGILSGTNIHVSGTVSPGSAVTMAPGLYLFVVTGETVHVKSGATQISGSGSPFVNGTQEYVYIRNPENWAFCSAGGTGLAAFTKVKQR